MTVTDMPSSALPETGALLGVWAHPDDEAYLSAGLMASARRLGQRVVVVTATFGERGTDDPGRWPPARLATRRRHEMAASLAALDVHEHRWLGYPDGRCTDVAEQVAVDAIAQVIEDVRPDTIVTFGPDGMTGHPDHRAVSAWTTLAWELLGSPARIWYATLLPSFHDEWSELNATLGVFADVTVAPTTPEAEAAAVVHCRGWLAARKAAALRAHVSQVEPLLERVGPTVFDRWWSVEAFAGARSAESREGRVGRQRRLPAQVGVEDA
jgi:LmbE family N-acetylglucosaminyl deacetylase